MGIRRILAVVSVSVVLAGCASTTEPQVAAVSASDAHDRASAPAQRDADLERRSAALRAINRNQKP